MKNKTPKLEETLQFALNYMENEKSDIMDSGMVLAGLCKNLSIKNCLNRLNVSTMTLSNLVKINRSIKNELKHEDNSFYTNELTAIMKRADKMADLLQADFLSCEFVFLAMLKEPNSLAYYILEKLFRLENRYVSLADAYTYSFSFFKRELSYYKKNISALDSLNEKNPKSKETGKKQKDKKSADEFGVDLVELARNHKIEKVIGRTKEIERAVNILHRKAKNNPVLIGEPGVGKSAIVEGLAYNIANGLCPSLEDCSIISLDMANLVAGSTLRGQFEEKLKKVIEYASENPNIILFIDEIHTIVGAGSSENTMDASNILKPYLARGEIKVIGATTIREYKEIEKDPALERRFQPIIVPEPSIEECIEMLTGAKKSYEKYHEVIIQPNVIESCVKLSKRYIQDRFLPDKAFDLLDETCARISLEQQNMSCGVLVKKEDVINTLEFLTGIKVISDENEQDEYESLSQLEPTLKANVIGQDDAVERVCRIVRRNKLGINDPKKPIGSFIFAGSTGVGKTELAKQLSKQLFGSELDMIRIDMSEYEGKESINKLIGAAPGYVGYGEEGVLTKTVRKKPYSIVLFDEVEKAHPDIFNVLLQVLDDGILTDSQGHKVNFKNTIIIMTTNLGYKAFSDKSLPKETVNEMVKDSLKEHFRPEFLNRVDEIVVFNQLEPKDSIRIVELLLKNLKSRLSEQEMDISFDSNVATFINKVGFDKDNGARPLKRAIQLRIEDVLADALISKNITKKQPIKCYVEDETIKFTN